MISENLKRQLRIIRRKKWPAAVAVILIAAIIAAPIVSAVQKNHKRFSPKNPIPFSKFFVVRADRDKIQLVAHRGYSAQAPENTIPAISKAREYGFDSVEIDVQQTSDGVWVLSHDDEVDSMTDKHGKISSYTYYDLVTCTVDNGAHHEEYENLKIPTFEQALKACLENNIRPMIEIKGYTEDGIKILLELVEKYGFTQSCSIISFDREPLELVRKQNPDIKLLALVTELDRNNMEKCLKDPTIGVSFCGTKKANSKDKIQKLLDAGTELACWTIDNGEIMKKYYEMGVTTFVSNVIYPK